MRGLRVPRPVDGKFFAAGDRRTTGVTNLAFARLVYGDAIHRGLGRETASCLFRMAAQRLGDDSSLRDMERAQVSIANEFFSAGEAAAVQGAWREAIEPPMPSHTEVREHVQEALRARYPSDRVLAYLEARSPGWELLEGHGLRATAVLGLSEDNVGGVTFNGTTLRIPYTPRQHRHDDVQRAQRDVERLVASLPLVDVLSSVDIEWVYNPRT